MVARLAPLALVAVAAMQACGSGGREVASPAPVSPAPAGIPAALDAGVGEAGDAAPALESLDALAARAPSVAAGMREVARGEVVPSDAGVVAREIVRADEQDVCVRVTLVAQPAVHAWLTDTRGDVLADARSVEDASLGTRGPVCVRKGSRVSLHIEASGAFVARFVGWTSP